MGEPASFLVIGLGNEFRGDDGCGPLVARLIAQKRRTGVRVLSSPGDGSGVVLEWGDINAAFVIDCVRSGSSPGKIFRFEPLIEDIPEKVLRPTSSHRLALTQIVRLAQALGRMPQRLIVYGVEGGEFAHGSKITPAVAEAAEQVTDRIVREIANLAADLKHE